MHVMESVMVHKIKSSINLLVLLISLLFPVNVSFAAFINLPNVISNRLASAAAG